MRWLTFALLLAGMSAQAQQVTFDRTGQPIKITIHVLGEKDFNEKAKKYIGKQAAVSKPQAFSRYPVESLDGHWCEVYTRKPARKRWAADLSHEIRHCLFGAWH